MSIKIRLDTSSLSAQHQSGVASYTRLLESALRKDADIELHSVDRPPVPLRLYAKLHSHRINIPYDTAFHPVDLTIFPNFAKWSARKTKKVATVIHDLTYLFFPDLVEEANLRHLRRVVPRAIRTSDLIITVSESVKAEIVKNFDVSASKIVVTPIPPADEFFQISTLDIHKKYKIPTKKYIYTIGNFEPRKNIGTLIDAYRLLPQEIKDEYSLIIGGGMGWKNKLALDKLKQAQAAKENVIHIGFVEQTDSPALYQQAEVFVFPSLYEGFGIPTLEAMASNVPVICSDIPVMREVGGEACLYANPQSAREFSDQILSTLNSKSLRQELVDRGRKNLLRFSWDKNVERIKNSL